MIAPILMLLPGAILMLLPGALGCSNILVSKGSAKDNHTHISYNADDAALFGDVARWEAKDNENGATRDVYSWDLGIYLGTIPEPGHTWNVIGNANEKGVVIGETTHGGLEKLSNFGKTGMNGTIIDYGSLIWLTLQRASSAREAIDVMVELCETYGYASDMEGFSIADKDEVWYMELLGRGDYDPHGILYVALRIPEGYVAAHANQARITDEFMDCDDPSWCRCSPDIIDFATKNGFYEKDDGDFSFSGVFDPVNFEGARFCEARVWYIFSHLGDDFDADYYLPYVRGDELSRRMPLYVKASGVTRDVMHKLMGSHFEDSWFDPSVDVGAGPEHSPNRWNDLSWSFKGATYVNERIVGTQYTGWGFVATIRGELPDPAKAILWFGPDDHSWSPKIPIHGGARRIHPSYDGADCTGRSVCRRSRGLPGTVTDFSFESAWWINNLVADVAYTRYDRATPVIRDAKMQLETDMEAQLSRIDHLLETLNTSHTDMVALLSDHAFNVSRDAHHTWQRLWQSLMVTFIDGKITTSTPQNQVCGCSKTSASFDDAWKAKLITDTGDKYLESVAPDTTDISSPNNTAGGGQGRRSKVGTSQDKFPPKSRRLHHPSRSKLSIKGVTGGM